MRGMFAIGAIISGANPIHSAKGPRRPWHRRHAACRRVRAHRHELSRIETARE